MSFLHTLGRALGFGHDENDDEIYTDTAPDCPETAAGDSAATAAPASTSPESEPADIAFDPAMRSALLDSVLAVFNGALPDFLQRSIDPQAQHKALEDALDDSIKTYLANLGANAERIAEARLRNASDAARADSERLRKEMERLEQQKTAIREQQLSADRRRRALQDRNRDLEEQVNRLEAEREQFELENKSLLNKIKLSEVQPGVIDDMQKEIDRLRSASNATETVDPEVLAAKDKEIETLKVELATVKENQADVDAAVEMSKQLYTQAQEELTGEREKRVQAEEALAMANEKLKEASEVSETIKELEGQLGKVEAIIAKRDERIASLKARNKKLKEELAAAAERAAHAKEGTKDLFAMVDTEHLAGEDDFECPDWFVSEPGPNTPPLRPANSDFGYTEPPKKPTPPDDDAQLSLF